MLNPDSEALLLSARQGALDPVRRKDIEERIRHDSELRTTYDQLEIEDRCLFGMEALHNQTRRISVRVMDQIPAERKRVLHPMATTAIALAAGLAATWIALPQDPDVAVPTYSLEAQGGEASVLGEAPPASLPKVGVRHEVELIARPKGTAPSNVRASLFWVPDHHEPEPLDISWQRSSQGSFRFRGALPPDLTPDSGTLTVIIHTGEDVEGSRESLEPTSSQARRLSWRIRWMGPEPITSEE